GADAGAHLRADRPHLVAYAARLSAPRLHDQYAADDRRLSPGRISVVRLRFERAMSDDTTTRLALAEQRARIALAAAGAMLVAGVLLMAAVLPAEYGVDPLGTGKLLGLTSLAQANAPAAAGGAAAEAPPPESLEPVRPGANTAQTVSLKQDTVTFKLGPFEGREYKYRMEKGASMVYSWTSTGK